jgi:ABC-2 type transport system ATP-binding protein
MIDVDRLTFDYPTARALHGVSLHVPAGSITALVGPNGAGKTTLLRCLAALEEPVEGRVTIAGVDALADPRGCHRQVGYLSDFFGLYDELTVEQCLRHAAAIRGVAAEREAAVTRRAAERLGILDRLGSRAGELSRGLRQRLAIAQAILHEPRVLLLDEPASGLDPEARHQLASLFLQLRDEGMTLLVSSHILAELDTYSTDMLVLRGGRIVSHEPVAGAATHSPVVRIALSLARPFEGLQGTLASIDGVTAPRAEGAGATFGAPADAEAQHRILAALLARGVPVSAFAPERRSLQDAYLATVAAPSSPAGELRP